MTGMHVDADIPVEKWQGAKQEWEDDPFENPDYDHEKAFREFAQGVADSVEHMTDEEIEAAAVKVFDDYSGVKAQSRHSPIPRVGGKFYQAGKIIPLIPEHTLYCEPFCGGAWVFFKKPPSEFEILNDLDSDVWNFFNVIKTELPAFLKAGRFAIVSRQEHDRLKDQDPEKLDPVQRAWRFFYLAKSIHGSIGSFNTYIARKKGSMFWAGLKHVQRAARRMCRTAVEKRDFRKCIKAHDRDGTFFYCDPPYYGAEKHYRKGSGEFTEAGHVDLRDLLGNIKGKFLLSYNDCGFVRDLYEGFEIRELVARWALNPNDSLGKRELLIANYPLPPQEELNARWARGKKKTQNRTA